MPKYKKKKKMDNPGNPEDEAMDAALAEEPTDMPPEQEMDAADADVAASRREALGAAAPPAAEELSVESMSTMGDAIGAAVNALSDGELPPQQVQQQLAVPGQPQSQVPPGLWSGMTAIQQSIEGVPEAEAYMFDPMLAATTNDEMVNASVQIHNLGQDKQAVQAVQRANVQAAPQAAPPQGTPPEQVPPQEA